MGIDVRWEDEHGNQLDEIADPKSYLGSALALSSLDDTVCLRFIDYYGDTTFNQLQISTLIIEFHALLKLITPERVANLNERWLIKYQRSNVSPRKLTVEEISEHISRILDLAERSKGETHTYLKFVGD